MLSQFIKVGKIIIVTVDKSDITLILSPGKIDKPHITLILTPGKITQKSVNKKDENVKF